MITRLRARTAVGIFAGLVIAAGGSLAAAPPVAAAWEVDLIVDFYKEGGFGDGRGTVKSNDGNIDCSYNAGAQSGSCSAHYIVPDFVETISVELTVTPATGSFVCTLRDTNCVESGDPRGYFITFQRFSDDDDKKVFPSLNLKRYTVLADVFPNGGQVLGNGSPCAIPAGSDFCQQFRHGDGVTLRAEPDQGSVFTGWRNAPCLGQDATCTFTAGSDVPRITATFNYWLVRIVSPADGGMVCAAGLDPRVAAGCAPPNDDFAFFGRHGRRHEFAADPAPGWRFKGWGGGPCGGQGATCVITVAGDATIKPRFELIPAPTATPKPTPKPTPKATPKATPEPTATPRPSAITAVGESAAPAQSIGASPDASAAVESPATTSIPGSSATEPAASIAPGSPTPTEEPVAPSAGSNAPGLSFMPLVLLALVAAMGTVLLGFAVGRRARRQA